MPFTVRCVRAEKDLVEGQPAYPRLTFVNDANGFSFSIRAYEELPLSDAIGLLEDVDMTGLMVWSGTLAMVEWLCQPDSPLQDVLRSMTRGGGPTTFLELGCGSGALSVALHALLVERLQTRPPGLETPSIKILATDGNPDCIELCRENLLRCAPSELIHFRTGCSTLSWGPLSMSCSTELISFDELHCPTVVVVSADVIYSADVICPLINTVQSLRSALAMQLSPRLLQWWLVYTPRSLTRRSNEAIFQQLIETLEGAAGQWTWRTLPLPPGSFSSGYDDADGGEALHGCIFVIDVFNSEASQ